jgi:2-keto-4-pentenoate hydratase
MTEDVYDHARRLLAASLAKQPCPLFPGAEAPPLLRGYVVQRAYIGLLMHSVATDTAPRQITGFKAALTNLAAQQALQMAGPAGGVLLSGHEYRSGCEFAASAFLRPMIEIEVGYRLAATVTSPVSVETVDAYIDAVIPMIEIADAGYSTPNAEGRAICGADLVAGNSAAGGYVIGEPMIRVDDPDQLKMRLARDGEMLGHARGLDALGGQRALLVWLINHSIAQGHELLAGHYLMTGALGRVEVARPGSYVAEYFYPQADSDQLFGRIEFEVT